MIKYDINVENEYIFRDIISQTKYICYLNKFMTRPFFVTDEKFFEKKDVLKLIKETERKTERKLTRKEKKMLKADFYKKKIIFGYHLDVTPDAVIFPEDITASHADDVIPESLTTDVSKAILKFLTKINRKNFIRKH